MVEHCIKTNLGVVMCLATQSWPQHLKQVKLDLRVIEPSTSPWQSHLVLVPKPDGRVQFCIDLQPVNGVWNFDAFPMPHVDKYIESLEKATYPVSAKIRPNLKISPSMIFQDACNINTTPK